MVPRITAVFDIIDSICARAPEFVHPLHTCSRLALGASTQHWTRHSPAVHLGGNRAPRPQPTSSSLEDTRGLLSPGPPEDDPAHFHGIPCLPALSWHRTHCQLHGQLAAHVHDDPLANPEKNQHYKSKQKRPRLDGQPGTHHLEPATQRANREEECERGEESEKVERQVPTWLEKGKEKISDDAMREDDEDDEDDEKIKAKGVADDSSLQDEWA